MIIYLWDAPPRCGVSGSLEKAQEAAGTTLIAGHAPSARVESARLVFSAALESAYARTGRVWQARSAKDGVITWEPGDTCCPWASWLPAAHVGRTSMPLTWALS